MKLLFALFLGFGLQLAVAQDLPPEAIAADVANPNSLVNAYFNAISGPPGGRNWNRVNSLFRADAQVNAVNYNEDGTAQVTFGTISDYIEGIKPFFQNHGFRQEELKRELKQYENIAQVFCSYKSVYFFPEDGKSTVELGMMSIQLVFDEDRWWISSLFWNPEGPEDQIQAAFLPEQPIAKPVDTPPTKSASQDTSSDYPDVNQIFDYEEAEVKPNYPTGPEGLVKFVYEHPTRLEDLAKAEGFSGKMTAFFVVEVDGLITEIQVEKTSSEALNNALNEVLKQMAAWEPGLIDFTSVRVRCQLEIPLPKPE